MHIKLKDISQELIPSMSSDEARKYFELENWKMFAQKIQRHPYVRQFIINRDKNICQCCHANIDSTFQLHHIDYYHACKFGKRIKTISSTIVRHNRILSLPDCEACHREKSEYFLQCTDRVELVHGICNMLIDKAFKLKSGIEFKITDKENQRSKNLKFDF
jgi:hypothetical protein